MENKKVRQSNFELLRIIAIVLIIVHHLFVHVVRDQLLDASMYGCGEMFNNLKFYPKLILLEYGAAIGKIGVSLFMLISGYFLCEKKNIDIIKIAKKLIGHLLFVTLVIVLGSFIYNYFFDKSFEGAMTISLFNQQFWFIGYYFIVVIIGYLFLNNYLNKLDNKKYLIFLIILFSLISFSYSISILESIGQSLSIVLTGVFLYSLGGYIKKYNPLKNVRSYVFVLIIIISFILMAISYRNSVITDINKSLVNGCYHQIVNLYSENIFVCLIISVSIFELFSRLKMKPNKVINYIAGASLITYIIHDNEFMYKILLQMDWIKPYYENLPYFIWLLFLFTVIIFVTGFIMHVLYKLIIKLFNSKSIKKLVLKNN